MSYELIGKARQLASQIGSKVCAVLVTTKKNNKLDLDLLKELVEHIDIFKYNEDLNLTTLDYVDCFKKHIQEHKPEIVLFGATHLARSFAPRVAAYFKTGITADCTELEYDKTQGLIQIRPAYGGEVIARIVTPEHYPQMATVRPGVMELPVHINFQEASLKIYDMNVMHDSICVIKRQAVNKHESGIEKAKIVILAGNAIKYKEELLLIKKLANLLGGEWATTRPLVEGGLVSHERQIGISGKTIRPELVIAFGVSGTTQTFAGISKAKKIIAVNNDSNAPIFKKSDMGIIADWKVVAKEFMKLCLRRNI